MTPAPAFLAYLDALPATVLSPGFRERISARERRGEYPFSRQNIYRVLFAAAPVLRRGWLTVADSQPLDSGDRALGTSLRCFRYLHTLLLNPAPGDGHAAAALEPIAARAVRVTHQPVCFCPPAGPGEPGAIPVDLALRLATTLRQYADLRWLGQHDQGFAGKLPVPAATGELTYTRCFSRLPASIELPSLEVSVTYRPPAGTATMFDHFRGELTQPPPRASATRAHISTPGTTKPITEPAAREFLGHAITAAREAAAAQPAAAPVAEAVVAGIFSRELCEVAASRGIDAGPWRGEITARLPYAAPATGCLTDAYLDTLAESAATWRLLCAGR